MSEIEIKQNHLNIEFDREKIRTAVKNFLDDMDRDRSSFFHLPRDFRFKAHAAREVDFDSSYDFLHLGIGGSALGAETVIRALAPSRAGRFHVIDHVDADALFATLAGINPERCLVYVVSKSGSTLETLSVFSLVYRWLEEKLGEKQARARLVFCTDPESGFLRELASAWNVPAFEVSKNLGGRFSVLGNVGLYPAACAGLKTDKLLEGAGLERKKFIQEFEKGSLPAVAELAAKLVAFSRAQSSRNITVLMPYSALLKSFAAWFVQLWAESLGKNGLGMTPVAATGPTDQHSILQLLRDGPQDKTVGFIEIKNFEHVQKIGRLEVGKDHPATSLFNGKTLPQILAAELAATQQVLANNKRPHFTVSVNRLNESSLGALFFFFETLTAVAGYTLGINPFDQPGVEEGKIITAELLKSGR